MEDKQDGHSSAQPYVHVHPFSPKLPSHPTCHTTVSRVPCAPQSALLDCLPIASDSKKRGEFALMCIPSPPQSILGAPGLPKCWGLYYNWSRSQHP